MAKRGEADGIETICATPHIRPDHHVPISELPRRLSELSGAIHQARCRARVVAGGEVAAAALDALGDDELAAVSLGGSERWILLEPMPGPLDASLDAAVDRLRDRGFRALIAHPERHLAPDLIERLRRLVRAGALVQGTAAYLDDRATREGMLELARAGVIHTLGSDAHSSRAGRPVALSGALEVLRTLPELAPHVEWIGEAAPRAIIAGQELSSPF